MVMIQAAGSLACREDMIQAAEILGCREDMIQAAGNLGCMRGHDTDSRKSWLKRRQETGRRQLVERSLEGY
jgi:hypothetical protein